MPLLLFLLSVAGLVAGSILVWRAWRTRYGTHIHCGSCNAPITVGAGRCHSCGRDINESTIAIGKHMPEWSLMMLGGMGVILSIAMILLASFWMSVKLQTSWYAIHDNQRVLTDLADSDGMHLAAARVLVQRLYADELSQKDLDTLEAVVRESLQKPEPAMLPRIDPRHVLAAELIWYKRLDPAEIDAYLSNLILVKRNQAGNPDSAPTRIVVGPKVIPGLPERFRLSPAYVVEVVTVDGQMASVSQPEAIFLTNGCYTLRLSEMYGFEIDARDSVTLRITATWYDLTQLDRDLTQVERNRVACIADDDERLAPLRAAIIETGAPVYATTQYLVSLKAEDDWSPVFMSGKAGTAPMDMGPPVDSDVPTDAESVIDAPPDYVGY